MKDRVEAYRRDVRRGVNPFEGAFPLWRNEQFVAAVVDAFENTPGDPGRLATFAETERAVLLEAQRRELRLLNQRDAREGAKTRGGARHVHRDRADGSA